MTYIAYYDHASDTTFTFEGADLAAAGANCAAHFDIDTNYEFLTNEGGFAFFANDPADAEMYWILLLNCSISDNDDWNHGETAKEAISGLAMHNVEDI